MFDKDKDNDNYKNLKSKKGCPFYYWQGENSNNDFSSIIIIRKLV